MRYSYILFSLIFISQAGLAKTDECFRTLIQDTSSLTLDSTSSFAMLDLMWKELNETQRKEADIDVTGYGSASSKRFLSRAQEFYRQTGVSLDQETKHALASQTLSLNSVEAYRICKDGEHKMGPRVIAYDATPEAVTVRVTWLSPARAPTESEATYQVLGGVLPTMKESWKTGESESFIVQREKGKPLRLTVTIGGRSDELFVPYNPFVKETVTYEVKKYPAGRGKRMANDGTGRNQGPITDCVYAESGQEIEPENAKVHVTTKVGNLDQTSYAKLTEVDYTKACYEAYLRPLSKSGGGDMWFHIGYRIGTLKYEIIE